jgi:hypothetical protein
MRSAVIGLGLALAAVHAGSARAQEPPPQFGRYMPMYPGLYFTGSYTQDDRDTSFDQAGHDVRTAAPQAGGHTRFPERSYTGAFTWHFPMFESYNVPFFSSRTHLARVTLRYTDTKAEGVLADFAADASDDSYTEADKLENNGSGEGDVTAEFGSFLYGSKASGWRTRAATPFAVLAVFGATLPFGAYNRDAPINAGNNTAAVHLKLGAHWQPWPGGFLDAGLGRQEFFDNYDPQFGALAPTSQGDEFSWDASLGQKVWRGLYASVFFTDRHGKANLYEDPRFAPNQSPPPNGTTSNDPKPGVYRDGGTELSARGVSLQYFVTQRWLAGLHYTHPQSGRSGQFLLPYTEHSPAGCIDGSTGCQSNPGEVILVDGMGPARSYSSNRLTLTVSYNFGLGDAFTCTGCEQ